MALLGRGPPLDPHAPMAHLPFSPQRRDIVTTPHPPAQKPFALLLGMLLAADALAGPVLPARGAPRGTAPAAAVPPADAAPLCGAAPARPPRFAPDESLKYRLALLGGEVGPFEIQIER